MHVPMLCDWFILPFIDWFQKVCFEFQMPTQTKLRHSWNSGVQKAFSELDQAPQAMWDLGARGANSAKDFIKEQMKWILISGELFLCSKQMESLSTTDLILKRQ